MPRRIRLEPHLTNDELQKCYRAAADPVERSHWHFIRLLASGMTATTVNIALFSVELEAFAREVGAGPSNQIVLVLDGAGWHDSPRVRVPEQTHLLILPPHAPELQPAEHLSDSEPLTNTCLVNRHFADLDELEAAQARRCVALQGRPDLIRSATRFQWWPLRIKKRQGPRQRDFRSRLGQFPSSDG